MLCLAAKKIFKCPSWLLARILLLYLRLTEMLTCTTQHNLYQMRNTEPVNKALNYGKTHFK